jgi:hypothetical protein
MKAERALRSLRGPARWKNAAPRRPLEIALMVAVLPYLRRAALENTDRTRNYENCRANPNRRELSGTPPRKPHLHQRRQNATECNVERSFADLSPNCRTAAQHGARPWKAQIGPGTHEITERTQIGGNSPAPRRANPTCTKGDKTPRNATWHGVLRICRQSVVNVSPCRTTQRGPWKTQIGPGTHENTERTQIGGNTSRTPPRKPHLHQRRQNATECNLARSFAHLSPICGQCVALPHNTARAMENTDRTRNS